MLKHLLAQKVLYVNVTQISKYRLSLCAQTLAGVLYGSDSQRANSYVTKGKITQLLYLNVAYFSI